MRRKAVSSDGRRMTREQAGDILGSSSSSNTNTNTNNNNHNHNDNDNDNDHDDNNNNNHNHNHNHNNHNHHQHHSWGKPVCKDEQPRWYCCLGCFWQGRRPWSCNKICRALRWQFHTPLSFWTRPCIFEWNCLSVVWSHKVLRSGMESTLHKLISLQLCMTSLSCLIVGNYWDAKNIWIHFRTSQRYTKILYNVYIYIIYIKDMIYVTEDSTYFRWQAHIWESTLHYTASSGSAEGRMAFKYTEVAVITPICSHRLWSIGGIPKIVCPGTCRLNLPQLPFTPISAGWPICTGGPQTRQKVKQTKKCTFKRTSREASNFDARWGKEMQKAPEVSKVRVIIRNIRKCLCKCLQMSSNTPEDVKFQVMQSLGDTGSGGATSNPWGS